MKLNNYRFREILIKEALRRTFDKSLFWKKNKYLTKSILYKIISYCIARSRNGIKFIFKLTRKEIYSHLTKLCKLIGRNKLQFGDRYGTLINLFLSKDGFQEILDKKNNQKELIFEENYANELINSYRSDLQEFISCLKNPYQNTQTKTLILYKLKGKPIKIMRFLKISIPL